MFDYHQPDARGHFGPVNGTWYGGTFVAETLIHALRELQAAYEHYRQDDAFMAEFRHELQQAARERVLKQHTFRHRAQELQRIVQQYL